MRLTSQLSPHSRVAAVANVIPEAGGTVSVCVCLTVDLVCNRGSSGLQDKAGGSIRVSMLGMEEFVTEEEEPWYDQQDLESGK
jgi:hypothetical protein